MEELNQAIVGDLQAMAQRGAKASEMLRDLTQKLGPKEPHKLTLIKYMRLALGLSLQQASPIAGWAADGTGELSDAQLDELVTTQRPRNAMSHR